MEQAASPAHVWRDERWDSFTLVTPNWALRMPGAAYNGADPDGFLPRDDVVDYFARYVDRFQLPIEYRARVESIAPVEGQHYRVTTPERSILAENVVVATGFEQGPKIPAAAASLSPNRRHGRRYRPRWDRNVARGWE